ncbi:head-to-tail joining protein [Rhizobium phage RHph_X3_9]|nr:head-to-tail joining protein [Rhizobium phage RHph_X3_9]
MSASTAPKGTLRHRWDTLHQDKGDLLTRSEQYAAWTLPNVFPEESFGSRNRELMQTNDSIGARGVNHLSNKVVTSLYRPQGPFFRLHLDTAQREQLEMLSKDSKKADVGDAISKVESVLSMTEKKATEYLDMVQYRPQAIQSSKLLIVTGNALEYHPSNGAVQVYSLRDYCVVRDVAGTVIEIMTRDCKAFETFSDEVKAQLRFTRQYNNDQYEDRSDVVIYTRIRLENDGKYHVTQAADLVELDLGEHDVSYPAQTLPWIALTWNLARGEDYGRGLVEDYAGAFHSIEVLTQSLINVVGVMGDIKFLVNPASLVDVQELNNSPSGSYHSGKEGDVVCIETNKQNDAQFIQMMIERFERQIAQAFLLNSAVTRDAERVTAEEIRLQAQELETSHGGIYSRLAHQWQLPVAYLALDAVGFDGSEWNVTPKIITGMDNLSRAGEMDNWRMWLADLAGLDAVPEDIRRVINPLKFAAMVGVNRQVDWAQVCYTDAELQQQQQAAMAQQNQMMQMQSQANVAQKAGEAAVTQE